ncbi:putative two-component system response regulator [Rhodococcus aetherivorans]|nr:putative two-component system response regulator [Rhodococcus aetherivorans]
MISTLDHVPHRSIAERAAPTEESDASYPPPAPRAGTALRCHPLLPHHSTSILRPELSSREVEVLLEWLRSDSKGVVARRLYVTESTVSTHLMRIRRKYAGVGRPAPTKAALVARAVQDGLIALDEL